MSVPSLVEICFQTIANTEGFIMLNGDGIKALPAEVNQRLLASMVKTVQSKLIMQSIALKIRLIRQNRLVTFKLKLHGTVAETVIDIFEKTGGGVGGTDSLQNYGLYQKGTNFRHPRWLRSDRTLSFYDLKPGEILDFKIKQTLLKVQFMGPWTTVKTFIVDESKTVLEITREIAEKIGIKNPEEYSLQIKKKNDSNGFYYIWLDGGLSLPEQGIDSLSCTLTLFLRKKYSFKDSTLSELIGTESLNQAFCQSLDSILSGANPCTISDAIRFAALQCQVRFGDFEMSDLGSSGSGSPTSSPMAVLSGISASSPSFFEHLHWEEYLPIDLLSEIKKIERDVIREYRSQIGISEQNAKYRYIQLARSLKAYGYTFFQTERISRGERKSVLFGVSKENILILDPQTKETITTRNFHDVLQWKCLHTQNTFWVYHLESDNSIVESEFKSDQAKSICQVIDDYVNPTRKFSEISPTVPTVPTSSANGSIGREIGGKRSVKERESLLREISMSKKGSYADLLDSQILGKFSEFSQLPNPRIKKCPIYIEPTKVSINPIFTNGIQLRSFLHRSDEMNYYIRMIRSLSCLHKSLGNQVVEREIRVKFPDKSVKSFIVGESKTIYDISIEVGEKVGIKNPEEFSLQKEISEDWLNPYQTLGEQGTSWNDTLLFKKKFHYHDAFVNNSDPVYFNLLFCQSHDAIVSGLYPCTLNEAVQLAATQFQINFGDHNPTIHQPGFLKMSDLKFFLPVGCLELWSVTFQKLEKLIYKEHQKLRGIKEEYAKFRYLSLCRSLSTYGTVFFQVRLVQHVGRLPLPTQLPNTGILLGFSRDSISFLTPKTKKVLLEYPLTHLRKWEGTPTTIKLDFGDYEEGAFLLATAEDCNGLTISKYLSDYLDFVQKAVMATQTFNTSICTYPPMNPETNFFLLESNSVCCWENGKRVFTSAFWGY